jgi:hypothetical protein
MPKCHHHPGRHPVSIHWAPTPMVPRTRHTRKCTSTQNSTKKSRGGLLPKLPAVTNSLLPFLNARPRSLASLSTPPLPPSRLTVTPNRLSLRRPLEILQTPHHLSRTLTSPITFTFMAPKERQHLPMHSTEAGSHSGSQIAFPGHLQLPLLQLLRLQLPPLPLQRGTCLVKALGPQVFVVEQRPHDSIIR